MTETGRRGITPQHRGSATGQTCPDVFRLACGDYLVIGRVATVRDIAAAVADHGASIGDDEDAVIVPGNCMFPAAAHIVAVDGPGDLTS